MNILNVQIRMRANLPQFAGGPEGSAFTVDYQHVAVILLNRKKAVMTGTQKVRKSKQSKEVLLMLRNFLQTQDHSAIPAKVMKTTNCKVPAFETLDKNKRIM